jgi:tetratricopeptide (TPR) repeat protein
VNHRVWIEEGIEPHRIEAFRAPAAVRERSGPEPTELLPTTSETWLLVPVSAPDFTLQGRTLSSLRGKPVLLTFSTSASGMDSRAAFQLVTVNTETSDDISGIYNILYRHLFDRRRDLTLPISFLIDEASDIVKIYQGPINQSSVDADVRRIPRSAAGRLAKALPFPGVSSTYEYGRNYISFGAAYFERGYLDQAEASFRSALRDDPSSAEAHYGLGSVYLKQEKLNDARDRFTRAVKLNGSYPETLPNAWNNLGLIATREGRIDEAIGYFQEALKINSDYWIALENIGNAYRQQKRWDEARAALERAAAIQPRDPEVNYSLGMVFAQTDDTGRAYEYLRKSLEYRPIYPEALNNLAVLYLRTGRRDDAVRTFEECIRVAPGFDQSYLNLARVYVLENAPDEARSLLRELLRQHPGHAQAAKALEQLP